MAPAPVNRRANRTITQPTHIAPSAPSNVANGAALPAALATRAARNIAEKTGPMASDCAIASTVVRTAGPRCCSVEIASGLVIVWLAWSDYHRVSRRLDVRLRGVPQKTSAQYRSYDLYCQAKPQCVPRFRKQQPAL